jgi:agmatinase
MLDFSNFDPNIVSNPNNNIFGLPTSEDTARLIIVPVPWEVTVSYGSGTARAPEAMLKASLQVDLYDPEVPDGWKQGYYMRPIDRKLLMKSDYLRKEAELYIDYISRGEEVAANQFMLKTMRDVNEGGIFLNSWVYDQTKVLLEKGKLVAILGGDHSVPFGYLRAIGEKHGDYGILQIDAHCDLREAYETFNYSHASVIYNVIEQIPEVTKIIQVGVRDFGGDEWEYLKKHEDRLIPYFDKDIKTRQFEGQSWKVIAEEIVSKLPPLVYISFDIDGLDRKLCPHTGTPVPGGFETEEVFYLFRKVIESGRKIIGFDLCEVGISESDWNANVGARVLFKLCNLLVASNTPNS